MSTPDFSDSARFFTQIFNLYRAGDYNKALDLATCEGGRFAHEAPLVYHTRACLASLLGNSPLALQLLRELMDAGYFYADFYWTDGDLEPLFANPEFTRLRALSAERLVKAQAAARPERCVVAPENLDAPLPLLIAMHGNNHNAAYEADLWSTPSRTGWLVTLAQSSQVSGVNSYVWTDRDKSIAEIQAHYNALCSDYPLDPERLVLGGFSMGAETSIHMALTGLLPARGFVAVAPGGPNTSHPELWQPLIEQAWGRGVRGYIIVGGLDNAAEPTRQMVEMFKAGGIECMLEDHADLGHEFPRDFAQRLPQILDYVTGR